MPDDGAAAGDDDAGAACGELGAVADGVACACPKIVEMILPSMLMKLLRDASDCRAMSKQFSNGDLASKIDKGMMVWRRIM
jgi:hypothetical protein